MVPVLKLASRSGMQIVLYQTDRTMHQQYDVEGASDKLPGVVTVTSPLFSMPTHAVNLKQKP